MRLENSTAIIRSLARGRSVLLATSAMAFVWAAPSAAHATDDQARPAVSAHVAAAEGSERESGSSGEIIVTAQKREQRLVDVPLSVVVLSGQDINDAGIHTLADLATQVPGLVVAETIGRQTTNPVLRGVGASVFGAPTVQVLLDGFSLGNSRTVMNTEIVDLERVEVLKGPQPTFYGRNTLGGVINYITRKPGNEFKATVGGEAATNDSYRLSASVEGPIVKDVLALQIGGIQRYYGGDLRNLYNNRSDVNGERDSAVRARLRFTPTSRLEANLTLNYIDTHDDCGDCSKTPSGFDVNNLQSYRNIGLGLYDFNDTSRTINMDTLGFYNRTEKTGLLNLEYDFGGVTLTSLTGASEQQYVLRIDIDRQPIVAAPVLGAYATLSNTFKGWSQELRLASKGDGRLTWFLGGYLLDTRSQGKTDYAARPPAALGAPVYAINRAIFGHAEFKITDHLSVAGGVRYDYDKRHFTSATTGRRYEQKAGVVLPTGSIRFNPFDALHLYATASRGSHSGGYNTSAATPVGKEQYDDEYVTNYEIGAKGVIGHGFLSYEAAIFQMDWTSQQISVPIGVGSYTDNVGESRIKGAELSVSVQPKEGLSVNAALSVLDGQFLRYNDPITTTNLGVNSDLSGNSLIYTPKFSASLGGQYVFALGTGDWDVRLRGDLSVVSARYGDPTNLIRLNGYELANFYAGVQNKRYEIGLFVNNAFDKGYIAGAYASSNSPFPPLLKLGMPRIAGIRARARF